MREPSTKGIKYPQWLARKSAQIAGLILSQCGIFNKICRQPFSVNLSVPVHTVYSSLAYPFSIHYIYIIFGNYFLSYNVILLVKVIPCLYLQISAKLGTGVSEVVNAIIERIPCPSGSRDAPFRALLFDSWYDRYRGALVLVCVKDGSVKVGDEVVSAHTGKNYQVRALGLLRPHEEPATTLLVS